LLGAGGTGPQHVKERDNSKVEKGAVAASKRRLGESQEERDAIESIGTERASLKGWKR